MLEIAISLLIAAIIIVAIIYIVSIWIYKRAPANMCFIRTGFLGAKVCLGRGALVLPVFHEVTWVSLEPKPRRKDLRCRQSAQPDRGQGCERVAQLRCNQDVKAIA